MIAVQLATSGRGVSGVTPALAGILAAGLGFLVVFLSRVGLYEPERAV
jgi:hypothetical protein